MKRHRLTIGLTAATFALSLAPLLAQDRSRPADAPTVGSAVARDSGSPSGSSSSTSGGSSGTSTSGGNSSSSGGDSGWTGNAGREAPRRAPVNPEYGEQRRGGGGATTGRAVPRDGGNSGTTSSGSTRSNDGADRQSPQGGNRAVPVYSRPRDGRNAIGTAVERPDGYYGDGRPYSYSTYLYNPYYSYYYNPYYRSRYYWSPWGYGFGFGYMAYDPFLFGLSGYGPGYYSGYDEYYGGGGYGGGGGYSARTPQDYRGAGTLRLKVKPQHAQVFVDGYLVGNVDDFDGVFQRLNVEAGSHRIELRADGYAPTQFEVMVLPDKTITYEGTLIRK